MNEKPTYEELDKRVRELECELDRCKQVEESTTSQARLLDLILKHSLDSIVLLDKDYNFIWVSETYAKIFQRDSSEFPGHNHFEFYPSNLKEEFDAAKKGKYVYQRASRPFVFPDHPEWGTTYWNLGLVPILDDDGEIEMFLFTLKDVTDRKRAEDALRESEVKFRNVADFTYDWEYWVGPDAKMVYVSPSCERITGYSAEEFLRNPKLFETIIHPDDVHHVRKHRQDALVSGEIAPIEFRIVSKGKGIRWIGHVCQPVYDSDGRNVGQRGSNRDITVRKKAEEALEAKNRLLQTVLDSSPIMIFFKDKEGRIILANRIMAEIYGKTKEEIEGKFASDFHTKEQARQMDEDDQEVITSGKPKIEIEEQYESAVGTRWARTSKVPLRNSEGEIFGMAGFAEDITEHKRAEEALCRSEERWRSLADNAPINIVIVNRAYEIIYVNRVLPGSKKEDVVGRSVLDFIPPEYHNLTKEKLASVLDSGEPEFYTCKGHDLQGDASWYDTWLGPIVVEDRVSAVTIIGIDITHRMQTEKQIAASLKEKEVLLREIHHRVKNNMQVIVSLLRMHSRKIDDSRLEQIFNDCRDQINAMSLIHEALYESENLARIDFEIYLKKLCRNLDNAYKASSKGIGVTVSRCNVELGLDRGVAVGMVVCELVANAFRHAFPDERVGKVSVSLSSSGEDDIELAVQDDGIGLPREIDILNTLSLGLKLVTATALRELGGTIDVERDGGTRFVIRFKDKSA